ncbi:hypothetical protein ACOQFV_24235 [Nocardiopsis changdeensis]|nr:MULTISPECIES: hypothetical protein [Nocardiopsis]
MATWAPGRRGGSGALDRRALLRRRIAAHAAAPAPVPASTA